MVRSPFRWSEVKSCIWQHGCGEQQLPLPYYIWAVPEGGISCQTEEEKHVLLSSPGLEAEKTRSLVRCGGTKQEASWPGNQRLLCPLLCLEGVAFMTGGGEDLGDTGRGGVRVLGKGLCLLIWMALLLVNKSWVVCAGASEDFLQPVFICLSWNPLFLVKCFNASVRFCLNRSLLIVL